MTRPITILYFAWLREQIGAGRELYELPPHVRTVGDLAENLRQRGPQYLKALSNTATLRYAVNQEFASAEQPIGPGDEIAFFPPVTGG
jgi:sulfur-carrier protein